MLGIQLPPAAVPRLLVPVLLSLALPRAGLAEEQITRSHVGQDEMVTITQPRVKTRTTAYDSIVFLPGDSITISAGGCVQTGGTGRTWKRYVDPRGGDSDRLYHGLVQILGATAGLVRVQSVLGKALTIPQTFAPPNAQQIKLVLGYEDDGYGDNGYWNHDDGTDDQCALPKGGPAWVRLIIRHRGTSQPPTALAPYDLTWSAADLNGLPLNPRWGKQVDPHEPGLPGMQLCAHPWEAPCTTQAPTIMDLPFPLEPLHPYNALCATSGPLGRHANWGIVTYEGKAKWDSWSSFGHDHLGADDDYNIDVWRADQAAYTQESPNFVHTEFDSDETIDHFDSEWWSGFHDAVKVDTAAAAIDGKDVIEIGVLGLDCAHSCGTEIHPVLAMAIHAKADPADDRWAIFARNSGNEGFCSHDSVLAPELSTVYVTLPAPPGAVDVAVKVTTALLRSSDKIQMTTFKWRQGSALLGLVLQVDLGDPSGAPMINGNVDLQWTMGAGLIAGRAAREARAARAATIPAMLASERAAASPEPEERFEEMMRSLPEATRARLDAARVRGPAPTWTRLQPRNLSAPPLDFAARALVRRRKATLDKLPSALSKMVVAPIPRVTDNYRREGVILREAGVQPPN